jgi:hypothetical protein
MGCTLPSIGNVEFNLRDYLLGHRRPGYYLSIVVASN